MNQVKSEIRQISDYLNNIENTKKTKTHTKLSRIKLMKSELRLLEREWGREAKGKRKKTIHCKGDIMSCGVLYTCLVMTYYDENGILTLKNIVK